MLLRMLKGTRLNDARYFRLPLLLHTRKRMMVIHVIQRVPNHFHVSQGLTINPNTEFETSTKSQYCDKTLKSKQSSVEITFVTCNDSEEVDQNKRGRQDICVETEIIEPPSDPSFLTQLEDVSSIVRNDSEKFAEFPRAEDDRRETTQKIVCTSQELQCQVERNCKSIDRKQNCGDRVVEIEEKEEKCNSWWRNGGQTILQFFAKILGKRDGMGVKGPMDCLLPTATQPGKRVKRISRGGKGHNRRRKDVDRNICLKRVDNGYIINHVYRDEGSRDGVVTKNKSRKKHHPSILVRQIQRTRDKNLRVMLLEQELHIRLPNVVKRDACPAMNNGINVRQLSSPLC